MAETELKDIPFDRFVHAKREKKPKQDKDVKQKVPYTEEQRNGQFNFDEVHGLKLTRMEYTVPTMEDRKKMRKAFDGNWKKGIEGERAKFLKYLAKHHEKELVDRLGLTKTDINRMKRGIGVKGYNVHHKLPIHGGGTNDFSNLILVPVFPHDQIHQDVMNPQVSGMVAGETRSILVPFSGEMIYNPQEFGFKKEGKFVEPSPATRVDENLGYYVLKNYRPEHIGVEKRQQYMQPIYDADRKKAQKKAAEEAKKKAAEEAAKKKGDKTPVEPATTKKTAVPMAVLASRRLAGR